MNVKELRKVAKVISSEIKNIREDYSGVLPEDIPEEITAELSILFERLKDIRLQLGKE